MNKSILLALVIAFGLGFGICYSVKAFSAPAMPDHQMSALPTVEDTSMNTAMIGMTKGLQDKSGDSLDIAFLEGMIEHHKGAVLMAETIVDKTKRPELKEMAEDIIGAQTSEITIMEEWLSKWYGR
jgi:uncharacterized protein (DUF305 family)